MNLVVNARDAMPKGGTLTIALANVELTDDEARAHEDLRAGSYVMLSVTDTGVGMDSATKERIFEPFFTTKAEGKGTGLGLSTVFGIVKQSRGHLSVHSELGEGTTFRVYFPRISAGAHVPISQRPSLEPAGGHETILVVDDDEPVRRAAADILRRHGYVVLEAANAGEALLVYEQDAATIHLLLTDLEMPLMSGLQLIERVLAVRPATRALLMSGCTGEALERHGLQGAGVAFLQKPLTPASLTAKVREVLGSAEGG